MFFLLACFPPSLPSFSPSCIPASFLSPSIFPSSLWSSHTVPPLSSSSAPRTLHLRCTSSSVPSGSSPHPGGFVHPPLRLSDPLVGPTNPQTAGLRSPRHPILGPHLPSGDTGVYTGEKLLAPVGVSTSKDPPRPHTPATLAYPLSLGHVSETHSCRLRSADPAHTPDQHLLLSRSVISDSVNPWTAARQAPLSVGFSRPEH